MAVLEIENLCKCYENFALQNVTFRVAEGRIVGFIGRNGAGKTTVLKSLLHFVTPDSGEVRFFGQDFSAHEQAIKQKIGFVSGGVRFYPKKKLRVLADVTRRFYPNWDDAAFKRYLQRFSLDPEKTPDMLSEGMKVKFSLALALSHHAELLILDEPTSGLDPVSRAELLDEFLKLQKEGVSILFSTHIISDLEKCADDIVYISNGRILAEAPMQSFLESYRAVSFDSAEKAEAYKDRLIGLSEDKRGCTALVRTAVAESLALPAAPADLEQIMVHLERQASV